MENNVTPVGIAVQEIALEAYFFGGAREEVRLHCEAVTISPGALIVHGLDASEIVRLRWTPDALSFESGLEPCRFAVGRPTVIGPYAARFPLM